MTLTLTCGDETYAQLWVVRGRLAYVCTDDLATTIERWAADGMLEVVGGEPVLTTAADPGFLAALQRWAARFPFYAAELTDGGAHPT